jgi:hypothetical protein
VGISLAPSKTPTVSQQQAAATARKQQPGGGSALQSEHSIDGALHDLDSLHLSPTAAAAAAAAAAGGGQLNGAAAVPCASKVPYRPLQEYSMERDLQK